MTQPELFADVILPLPLQKLYTYHIPPALSGAAVPGQRVVVQFGKRKLYTAVVRRVHNNVPAYEAKDILSIMENYPVVTSSQMELWDWIASYYMCTPGEVMNAALPAGLRLHSETRVALKEKNLSGDIILPEAELEIIRALQGTVSASLDKLKQTTERKNIFPVISSLIEKGFLVLSEEFRKAPKQKPEIHVRLSGKALSGEWMKSVFEQLEKKAPAQLNILMVFYRMLQETGYGSVSRADLLKHSGGNSTALAQLIKKDILVMEEKHPGKPGGDVHAAGVMAPLDAQQETALSEIKDVLKKKDVVLLHGVTSSGKTELYIRLMEEAVSQGKHVLYLLPEIALTTQVTGRIERVFGDKAGVYHSRIPGNERVEIWNNMLKAGRQKIIVGARSSLFLPFDKLGLLIVDEEHDTSFKQHDPAPRYNARDTAVYLARLHGAKVLMGSATPALETYFNARQGKYGLVTMSKRFGGILMPEIDVVNTKEERRKKKMKTHFSPFLLDSISNALAHKEQVILFRNRRGYAPVLECASCAWVPRCPDCDVSLTYHKNPRQLRCHYCGHSSEFPAGCPACGDTNLRTIGFGTEKIEEELAVYFPDAVIGRMDLDATRTKNAYRRIIGSFEKREVDILVGTQMLTKGLDFDNVSTVGILNADSMLSFPDFRAFERSYQLMAQVSGRAGRKNKRGKVIIQTSHPEHYVIRDVVSNDYTSMYTEEMAERKKFRYPPYYRLIEISLRHRDPVLLTRASSSFAAMLRTTLGKNRVLGPEAPPVPRIRNLWTRKILVKTERETSPVQARNLIISGIARLKEFKDFSSVLIQADADPM